MGDRCGGRRKNYEKFGNFENFYVGGINSNAKLDNLGPEIQLFINDTTFVSGGYTDDSPNLLALLYDNSGINTVGTGIGHDLVAILDGLTNNPYILNDNYESDLNTYQSGRVSFEFSNISNPILISLLNSNTLPKSFPSPFS